MPNPDLASRNCMPVPNGTPALDPTTVANHLKSLNNWNHGGGQISRTFSFKNHYETMAFVNAVAWVSHQQDHHPDMTVGYNKCAIKYSTHSVGGLSENDFICAAKVDQLMNN